MASEFVEEIRAAVKSRIMACDSTSKFKDYLGGGLKQALYSYEPRISALARVLIYEPLVMEFQNIDRDYRKRFKREYEKIENILGMPARRDFKGIAKSVDRAAPDIASASCSSLVSVMDSEENFKIGGGFAAGIGISLLVTGVGWVVGGILTMPGGLFGAGLLKV